MATPCPKQIIPLLGLRLSSSKASTSHSGVHCGARLLQNNGYAAQRSSVQTSDTSGGTSGELNSVSLGVASRDLKRVQHDEGDLERLQPACPTPRLT